MFARLLLMLVFAASQLPTTSMAGTDGAGHPPEPVGSHCAEDTGDSVVHHCDHVTQCQCDHACGGITLVSAFPPAPQAPRLTPRLHSSPRTLAAILQLPFRPPTS